MSIAVTFPSVCVVGCLCQFAGFGAWNPWSRLEAAHTRPGRVAAVVPPRVRRFKFEGWVASAARHLYSPGPLWFGQTVTSTSARAGEQSAKRAVALVVTR